MTHTLKDYGLTYKNVQVLHDNMCIINLTKNPSYHSRTKHLKMKHHFIRDYMVRDNTILNYIESKLNLPDIFTKLLSKI